MSAIYIEIAATRGSAPRDAGTVMRVTATDCAGTIGGGALEYRAIATARRMLVANRTSHMETYPLGPGLGQCCGGSVTLSYGHDGRTVDVAHRCELKSVRPPARPVALWIWGAGHVGRAVIDCCPANAFDITWIDSAADRFPDAVPPYVTQIPVADMPRLARRAPQGAHHLIFTYSHDIDLALCAALLKSGARQIGLIGSATKRARFERRLRAAGLDPTPITCPIGDKKLGKAPHEIAHGTINALLALAHGEVSA
ncbi:xanthine dehydrogenase accessory protein XdhC [uncultured Sulfitobacter sp.]|uniref:xanthine dehydrogenase accessory protein XdhC n=1 Tax=uncultured Sulfitobacter sp. TaxID=191468 RepID=UPI0026347D56|nr:xanthine dehydrogenase accessory protein XdhC [uncultured Sulfitobacter sp.]